MRVEGDETTQHNTIVRWSDTVTMNDVERMEEWKMEEVEECKVASTFSANSG